MLVSTISAIILAPFIGLALGIVLRGTPYELGPVAIRWGLPLSTTAVATWAAMSGSGVGIFWANCVLGWGLVALAWIDWHHLILPDLLTLPLVVVGLAATVVLDPDETTAHAIGAAAGYGVFRLLAWAYQAVRRREGLGQGDAKLLATAGAWLGWEQLAEVVLFAAVLGIAWASARAWRSGYEANAQKLPFGTFIAVALWVVRLHATSFPAE